MLKQYLPPNCCVRIKLVTVCAWHWLILTSKTIYPQSYHQSESLILRKGESQQSVTQINWQECPQTANVPSTAAMSPLVRKGTTLASHEENESFRDCVPQGCDVGLTVPPLLYPYVSVASCCPAIAIPSYLPKTFLRPEWSQSDPNLCSLHHSRTIIPLTALKKSPLALTHRAPFLSLAHTDYAMMMCSSAWEMLGCLPPWYFNKHSN